MSRSEALTGSPPANRGSRSSRGGCSRHVLPVPVPRRGTPQRPSGISVRFQGLAEGAAAGWPRKFLRKYRAIAAQMLPARHSPREGAPSGGAPRGLAMPPRVGVPPRPRDGTPARRTEAHHAARGRVSRSWPRPRRRACRPAPGRATIVTGGREWGLWVAPSAPVRTTTCCGVRTVARGGIPSGHVRISGAQAAMRVPPRFAAAWAKLSANCAAMISGMRAAAAWQASSQGFSRIGL